MKEIEQLIKRAEKYLSSAELLIDSGDYESSVSRSYYAMFYTAEAVLLTKSLRYSSHKGVISGFGEHFVKTGVFTRDFGRELNRAFQLRQLGDYEYTFIIGKEEAKKNTRIGRGVCKEDKGLSDLGKLYNYTRRVI